MRLLYGFLGAGLAAALMLFPVLGLTSSSGSPPGFSGGPAENGATCQVCHSSFDLNSGTGSVWVEAPEDFIPGQAYTLLVAVDNTTEQQGDDPVQGFQISVQDADGNHVGELLVTDPTHTRFSGATSSYITHTMAGRFVSEWELSWTAPAEGDAPEAVTIYVTGNAAAGTGSPMGDHIYSAATTVPRQTKGSEQVPAPAALAIESIHPNPARVGATARVVLAQSAPVQVTLFDGLGRVVRTVEVGALVAGEHDVSLPVAGLAAGLYFVEIATPVARATRPLSISP